MTVTADTAPRQNGYGRPCPPWCAVDHSRKYMDACVGSGSSDMYLGAVWARAVIGHDGPRVIVDGRGNEEPHRSAYVPVEPRDAEQLATFVELLADVAPADVRQLAAAIRKAAADITEASHA